MALRLEGRKSRLPRRDLRPDGRKSCLPEGCKSRLPRTDLQLDGRKSCLLCGSVVRRTQIEHALWHYDLADANGLCKAALRLRCRKPCLLWHCDYKYGNQACFTALRPEGRKLRLPRTDLRHDGRKLCLLCGSEVRKAQIEHALWHYDLADANNLCLAAF